MIYLRVHWSHSFPDEPVWFFYELDDQRWTVRTVEVYRDGRRGYAKEGMSVGGTELSEVPISSMEEIAADSQFEPSIITSDEFEKEWAACL
jgi:hypothetical protein